MTVGARRAQLEKAFAHATKSNETGIQASPSRDELVPVKCSTVVV